MSTGGPRRRLFSAARRAPAAPLFVYLFRALFLRGDFYDLVASDPNMTRPAVALVCLSSLAYGGTLMPISPEIAELARTLAYWILPLLMALGVAHWLVASAILWGTGNVLIRQRPPFTRLLRCLGFAQAPAFLSLIMLFDPTTETWLRRVIQLWLLAATIVAVRAAYSTTFGRAAATGVAGFLLDFLLPQLIAFLMFLAMG
jgi:hypothetical protein